MSEVRGRIKNLNDKKFGFIEPDKDSGSKQDIFFHQTSLVGASFSALRVGDKVVAEVQSSPKGPKAVKVELE